MATRCFNCKKKIPVDEIAVKEFENAQNSVSGRWWRRYHLCCPDCSDWELPDGSIEEQVKEKVLDSSLAQYADDEGNCIDEEWEYTFEAYEREREEDIKKLYPEPCEGCGRLLVAPYKRTDARHICSSSCSARACRPPKRLAANPCGHCGETYQPKRSDQRFCSINCRRAVHREAKKGNK